MAPIGAATAREVVPQVGTSAAEDLHDTCCTPTPGARVTQRADDVAHDPPRRFHRIQEPRGMDMGAGDPVTTLPSLDCPVSAFPPFSSAVFFTHCFFEILSLASI